MRRLLLGLIFISVANFLYAETIVLKSGKTLEGKIIEQTDEYIKIKMDFLDTAVTYFLDDVDTIDAKAIGLSQEEKLAPPPSGPLPSGTIDAKVILEKIKEAAKNVNSFEISSISEINIPEMVSAVVETITDIDSQHKKISGVRKIKEMNIFIEGQLKGALEKKIRQAQLQGVPPEKIEQIRSSVEGMSSQMNEVMNKIIEKAKTQVAKSYVVDDVVYINISDKWVKMEIPLFKEIWKPYDLRREGFFDKESLKKAVAQTQYLENIFAPFLDFEPGDMFEVSEGEFLGQSCYIIETQDKKIFDKIREVLGSIDRITGTTGQPKFDPNKLILDSILLRQYVSKNNFLPLHSLLKMQLHLPLEQPLGSIKEMGLSLVKEDSWVFPGSEIVLPKEAEAAKLVESEEEAKEILMDGWGK